MTLEAKNANAVDSAALRSFAPTLILLVIALLINYVDRGNLALAAPLLKIEWGMTASQLGVLLSAFFWTYTALQFVMGLFVDRWGANRMMALGFLAWSLATVLTGAAMGFATLLAMRLLLGVGESVMFPASSKIMAQHLPEHARGFANGLMNASMRWGSAIGTFGGGLLMARYGWRAAFVAIGVASLVWLPAWSRWKAPTAPKSTVIDAGLGTFSAILRKRAFWGAASGHFCANYLVYFLMSWLPYYLVNERHLSMAAMSVAAGALWVVDSLTSLATGTITDFFIRRGTTPTIARKSAMAFGFALAAVSLAGCAFAGEHTYLACLIACASVRRRQRRHFRLCADACRPARRGALGGPAKRHRQHGRDHRSRAHRSPRRLDRPLRRSFRGCRRLHPRRGVCVVSRRYPSSAGRLHLISR